jgi:hypothetical protein
MKHKPITLAIALSQLGFADMYEECCPPPPCYEPPRCINCECYVPIDQPVAGCDTFVSVDFLYWFARERNLCYAIEGEMLSSGSVIASAGRFGNTNAVSTAYSPEKYKALNTKWDPGVRVGLGWASDCNDWDVGIDWTYYHNEKKNAVSADPFAFPASRDNFGVPQGLFPIPTIGQSALFSPWVNQAALVGATSTTSARNFSTLPLILFFTHVSAKWDLTLNNIDLDIGRTFWFRNCFSFRPYAGIRGSWAKTRFQIHSDLVENPSITIVDNLGTTVINIIDSDLRLKDRFIDRFWGVGILLGISPNWYICHDWSIFADFAASLIYGKSSSKKRENYSGFLNTLSDTGGSVATETATADFKHSSRRSFFAMQPIFDLALGLRFEKSWCCNRYYTEFDLAWEHHIWIENNYRMINFATQAQTDNGGGIISSTATLFQGFSGGYDGVSSTLDFGGPVLRVRFDF